MAFSDLLSSARRAARREIADLLRHGLLTFDEIVERLEDDDKKLTEEVVRGLVADEWKRMSRTPVVRPTPLDRLQAAYDALDASRIMARHYPLGGRSDADSWIHHELALATQQGASYAGYCYYDQHLAGMMSEGQLGFCFGPASESKRTYAKFWHEQTRIGTAIVDAFTAAGFKVAWNGTAADVIMIGDVAWSGPRDAAGAPLIATGTRLEGRVRERANDNEGEPTSVFVSGANGRPDAHQLIAAIASTTRGDMYGAPSTFASAPAAVAHTTSSGAVLDFVAVESPAGARGLLAARDMARACSVLVEVSPSIEALSTHWWPTFQPARRILVLTGGGDASVHDGSRVVRVELGSGSGVEQLLAAVAAATSER